MSDVDDRLSALGLELPPPGGPAGAYSPVVVDGTLAYTSGVVALESGDVVLPGRLGAELTVEEGRESARGACLRCLGNLAHAVGGLERVERVLKVTGYVQAAPGFTDLPAVLDGASELLVELFGEPGRGARTTVGVAALPRGASVELDLVVRVRPG